MNHSGVVADSGVLSGSAEVGVRAGRLDEVVALASRDGGLGGGLLSSGVGCWVARRALHSGGSGGASEQVLDSGAGGRGGRAQIPVGGVATQARVKVIAESCDEGLALTSPSV